jgi:uracil-DNA glycosylase family 4
MPSQFSAHVARWRECQLCPLCTQRSQVVFARGDVPCEALFLAEAPGDSEDVIGLPLIGPAGKLLDKIVEQALASIHHIPTVAFANLVGCFPKIAKAAKTNEPTVEEIKACAPRLKEFVNICDPSVVVLVGKLAARWAYLSVDMANPRIRFVEICHPASILKGPTQNYGLSVQKCVLTLSDAFEEHFDASGG